MHLFVLQNTFIDARFVIERARNIDGRLTSLPAGAGYADSASQDLSCFGYESPCLRQLIQLVLSVVCHSKDFFLIGGRAALLVWC
jgi:hypothetical protein